MCDCPELSTLRSIKVLITAALALALAGPIATDAVAQESTGRPNIIVITTDDQTVGQLNRETMPRTMAALRDHGTSFSESVVTSPLCCPSRAAFITGQYAHNNNVFDNTPGYPALNDKGSTLFSWLGAAGYRSGIVGRFLLNYDKYSSDPSQPPGGGFPAPPGVEDWFGYVGPTAHYFDATFSRDGTPVDAAPTDYTTTLLNREARSFVRAARSDPRPFFLWLTHVAPHSTDVAAPFKTRCGAGVPLPRKRAIERFRGEQLPRPPSFDEQKLADKPAWVDFRRHLGPGRLADLARAWRCALGSLDEVDRGVGSLVRQLDREGELDDTAIFFTSDNGYFYGEHRIFLQKVYPYEEAIRVPLLARVPGRFLPGGGERRPAAVDEPVSNIDLTATVLELARAAPCDDSGCRTLDGRSLVGLLGGDRSAWPRRRGILISLGYRDCGTVPPADILHNYYDAIRTDRDLYVELDRVNPDTGACDRPELELYDLAHDPFELRNRAALPEGRPASARQTALAARLARLRQCAGIAGRDPVGPQPFCE